MKKMKKIISTLAIFLFVATISMNAQPRPGNGMHPLISQYGEELNLTNDQMKELAELNMEYRQEVRGSMQGRRGNRGFRENRRNNRNNRSNGWIEAREDYHAKVMDILTDDQKELLRNAMIDRAESAHQFRMVQHEVIADEAGLEGEKREQVLNLMNEHSRQILEARLEIIDTPGFGQFRGEGLDSRNELQNELKELLTAEEYETLRDVMGTQQPGKDARNGRRGNSRFN